jgi:hypothetical protein
VLRTDRSGQRARSSAKITRPLPADGRPNRRRRDPGAAVGEAAARAVLPGVLAFNVLKLLRGDRSISPAETGVFFASLRWCWQGPRRSAPRKSGPTVSWSWAQPALAAVFVFHRPYVTPMLARPCSLW